MNKNGYFQSDKDGNVTKAPPKKQPPPFDGGVTSWNDLPDRPFGETVENVSVIEWDGTPTDVSFSSTVGPTTVTCYKVSDLTPDSTYLVGGRFVVPSLGADSEITAESISISQNVAMFSGGGAVIAYEDGAGTGSLVFPEKGIYGIVSGDAVLAFTLTLAKPIEVPTITPVPTEYLPKALQFGETVGYTDTLTWDGTPTDVSVSATTSVTLYKVSDVVPTVDDLVGGHLVVPGFSVDAEITSDIIQSKDETMLIGEIAFVALSDNVQFNGYVLPQKGIYGLSESGTGYGFTLTAVNDIFPGTVTKPLDAKYLPNMRINITATEDDEGNVSYSADKTYAEIAECIQAGGLPYCVMGNLVMQLSYSSVIPEVSTFIAAPKSHEFFCVRNLEFWEGKINEDDIAEFYLYRLTTT